MDGASLPSCRPSMRNCRRPFIEVGPIPGPLSLFHSTPGPGTAPALGSPALEPHPAHAPLCPERLVGVKEITSKGPGLYCTLGL